ncbi:F-box/FBD/LRR-repeat protein At1g13570-like isoform X2 [Ipomoea triloba]|uniref:F-box/FBD/LRR-repeat protein At1g13570-like isoform X2 n=1 Tax=Ipomoea triloba TaxID=35885 RepID=UPI00125D1837|nr:F-box/FBD/LRR-repeat protein At1g13570-like isoform X2 [Ipomoea triloba]
MAGSSIEIVPDARRDLISELPAKAQTKHQRIVPDANRDLISELPLELKVSILECLPTRDAARTVLLSTHWNDVWLRLGRLAFDKHFFCDIRKCSGKSIVPYKIITYILLQRVQPVKKFSLHLSALFDPTLEQSNLDEWCLYLSRNGIEELHISCSNHCYKLPFCIVSCPTIKQLELWELDGLHLIWKQLRFFAWILTACRSWVF